MKINLQIKLVLFLLLFFFLLFYNCNVDLLFYNLLNAWSWVKINIKMIMLYSISLDIILWFNYNFSEYD